MIVPGGCLAAMLLRGLVDPRPVALPPGAGDRDPGLLGERRDEPAHRVLLPARLGHNFLQCGAAGAEQHVVHDRLLAERARHPRRGRACCGLGSLGLLRGLGATGGAGVAAWGAGAASSFWIAAQMRAVAFARFSNFFTGFRSSKPGVPAKLFQVSTRRLIGHSAVALLSSFWLAKAARLSCAAGAAAWAVMLLSVSIVNVVIVVLLWVGGALAPPGLVPQWLLGAASRT